MLACMQHEPWYGAGSFSCPELGVHLGWTTHTDVLAGAMPFWNETQDVCLVFAGEEFTDAKERDALRFRGHRFSVDDASHVVHLYEEHGADFVGRLNGWFSGLLVDRRNATAMLFNDRYGVGRLYFRETEEGLYFSSEAKSLLRLFPDSRRLDSSAVAETFSFGCVLNDRTLYQRIALMPPASAWAFDRGGLRHRRSYFAPGVWECEEPLSQAEFDERLRAVFPAVLPRYLRGPGACAMSLTGGLDGRMVMAWARQAPGTLPCYSFSGSYRESLDVKIARKVAQTCGQPHLTISVGESFLSRFPALAERCVYISDGAMDVSGAVELHVNRAAREVAPIRLTGNYGSEIMRGNVAFRPRPLNADEFDPEFFRQTEQAAETYTAARRVPDLSFIAFKQVPWHHHARLSVEQAEVTLRSPFLDNDLVSLVYRAPEVSSRSHRPSLWLIHEGTPALARISTDRGLAFGRRTVASRISGLVHQFTAKAEYAFDYGMPPWLAKVDHALAPLGLERIFLGRHKFYHFRTWYRHRLAAYVKEILLDRRSLERSHYRPGWIEQIVDAHVSGQGNHTLAIHRALTLELIHRQLLDRWAGEETFQ